MRTRRIPLTFAVRKGRKTGFVTYTQVRNDPTFRKQVLDRIFTALQKWRDQHADTLEFLESAPGIKIVDAIDDVLKRRTERPLNVVHATMEKKSTPRRTYRVVYAKSKDAAKRSRGSRTPRKKRSQ